MKETQKMRTPLVAGNWKMNKTVAEARDLAFNMAIPLREIQGVEKVICPPFLSLVAVSSVLVGTDIGLGAQNMHWEAKGAFTGEVAPNMVAEFCRYVILGHSERRTYFGETDESVNKKVRAAQAADLTPIVCVGETLAQYEVKPDGGGGRASNSRWPGWHGLHLRVPTGDRLRTHLGHRHGTRLHGR